MTKENRDIRLTDHLANERTFLAWIRTSLGIIAFGFVIERFGLFIKQMGLILGKAALLNPSMTHGFSEIIGVGAFLMVYLIQNLFPGVKS